MNEQDLKKALAKLLEEAKEKKRLDDIARKEKNEQDRMSIFAAVTRDLGGAVAPFIKELKDHTDSVVGAIKNAGAPNIEVKVPEIKVPAITIPAIRVPTPIVNFDLSKIKVPDVRMPDEMNVKGWVGFQGYDRSFLNNPLPVQLRDSDGNPVKLFENLTSLMTQSTGGGGGFPMAAFVQSDQSIRVSGSLTVAGSNSSTHIIDASNNIVGSAANPLNVALVSGALTSVVVVGPTNDGGTDDGSSPLKVGGIARTTNPTAHGDGQSSALSLDSLGRQITRPVQVRALIATAYASVSNGTETTLLAGGGAGVFHDMIFIQFSNNSTAAVGVDIRGVTGGNVEMHYEVPANSVVGGALPVPYPQGSANNNWTVDLPDITGTTVTATALFSKEI